jgi:hypothetical protein
MNEIANPWLPRLEEGDCNHNLLAGIAQESSRLFRLASRPHPAAALPMPSRLSTTNRIIAVTIGCGVTFAQAISAGVGWQAMASTFERIASAAAAPFIGAAAAGLWVLVARTPESVRRLLLPSVTRVERTVADARAAGLLPEGYVSDPHRDLLVARTIAFDRKAGLTDDEIRKDLADQLAAESR